MNEEEAIADALWRSDTGISGLYGTDCNLAFRRGWAAGRGYEVVHGDPGKAHLYESMKNQNTHLIGLNMERIATEALPDALTDARAELAKNRLELHNQKIKFKEQRERTLFLEARVALLKQDSQTMFLLRELVSLLLDHHWGTQLHGRVIATHIAARDLHALDRHDLAKLLVEIDNLDDEDGYE
jgi:hypothetical protein